MRPAPAAPRSTASRNAQVISDAAKIPHVKEAGHGQRGGAGPGWRVHGKRDHAPGG